MLETSYIVFLLPSYHRNFDKRIVKAPKLYFYDTGLACYLLNIKNDEQLNTHFAKGALFENMVVTEWLKKGLNTGVRPALYFWRDSNHKEIDLLHEEGGTLTAIEIKAGNTIQPSFAKKLLSFQEAVSVLFQLDLKVIYGGEAKQVRSGYQVLPWDSI